MSLQRHAPQTSQHTQPPDPTQSQFLELLDEPRSLQPKSTDSVSVDAEPCMLVLNVKH